MVIPLQLYGSENWIVFLNGNDRSDAAAIVNGETISMDYLDEQIKSYLKKRNDEAGTNL